MDPSTPEEWLEIAGERAADAAAMLTSRQSSVGPVYMAGYAVECALKAYLQRRGRKWPKGKEGHDARGLWRASEFQLRDLKDRNGAKSFFVQDWSTNLRYRAQLGTDIEASELVKGAQQLSGWIRQQIRRAARRKKS